MLDFLFNKKNVNQEITQLKETVQDLQGEIDKLNNIIGLCNLDNLTFSIYFDFTVPESILSIEYDEDNSKCVICYLKKFDDNENKHYHEWMCFCSVKQYNDLYAKYMEYLKNKNT